MAKVFLDTNWLIDIFMRETKTLTSLAPNDLFASPLSYHITCYTYKVHTPSEQLIATLKDIGVVNLTTSILKKSLEGPSPDVEDNIQLHSASMYGCDYFLTSDKYLLNMKHFGQVEIVSKIPSSELY
jgi:predicted nucleic acid-binding protein